jgi:hypothetical protein
VATSRSRRYQGTDGYIATGLYFDALTAARNARQFTNRKDGKVTAMAGLEALAMIAEKPPWWDGWAEALEWVAELLTGAANHIVNAASHAPRRKAVAMLSCLGRTAAAIKGSFSAPISEAFVAQLLRSPDFLALPLRAEQRISFRTALEALMPGDNLRHVLAAAQIPWAGVKQWEEFQRATREVAAMRDGGEYQFGDEHLT